METRAAAGAWQQSKTISAKLAALTAFETFTRKRAFASLRREDVEAFKDHVLERISAKTGERLASSTIVHTLEHC
nr:hypothetical protein [Rhizobiaceae bacterium]